jgi:hypothetical protein
LAACHQIIDAYLGKKGLTKGSIRFLFDGNQIKEHQTPEEVRSASRPQLPPGNRNQRPLFGSRRLACVLFVWVCIAAASSGRVGCQAPLGSVGTSQVPLGTQNTTVI